MAATPFIVRKTYARFLMAGTFLTDDQEVPVGDRDPLVPSLGGPPSESVAVMFFDRVEAEVEDPVTGLDTICTSEPLDLQPGWTYFKGRLIALPDLARSGLPTITRTMITALADRVKAGVVVITSDGTPRPYFPGVDTIIQETVSGTLAG